MEKTSIARERWLIRNTVFIDLKHPWSPGEWMNDSGELLQHDKECPENSVLVKNAIKQLRSRKRILKIQTMISLNDTVVISLIKKDVFRYVIDHPRSFKCHRRGFACRYVYLRIFMYLFNCLSNNICLL